MFKIFARVYILFNLKGFALLFNLIYIKYFIFFTIKKIKYDIIGLFRSTVLRVMSPTRFLCATMIVWYPPARFHYASMTRLICAPSLNAFPSHIHFFDVSIFLICHWVVSIHLPLARIRPGMLPLHYNDLIRTLPVFGASLCLWVSN